MIPPLPLFPTTPDYPEQAWSPNVYGAYGVLQTSFNKILTQEADPRRIPGRRDRY
ncbi:hypothetical protein BDZ89DRAFT_1061475, partial [Hymenopellis radicata]